MMGNTATANIEEYCSTESGARRFLQRATFGPRPGDVDHLMQLGPSAWFEEQIAMDRGMSHLDHLRDKKQRLPYAVWEKILTGDDQLRRRVAYSLSQIFVVSDKGVNSPYVAAFADLLEDHAFGSFRDLLEAVTLSGAMSHYLSLHKSAPADPSTGASPDENYAREVMQLFTIGLWELESDGTRRLDGGQPVPTYDLDDVIGLARAFTGWNSPGVAHPQLYKEPLVPWEPSSRWHERGEKTFLGMTIAPGTGPRETLRLALDHLAGHPNVGPFFGRLMIQRLVTSNPSPAYVRRVAAVFADDGTGTRGNLEAVVGAILSDPEAVSPGGDAEFGKVREPVLRFTVIGRAFSIGSTVWPWKIGRLDDPAASLGQQPYQAPSVFNFFSPSYVPNSPGFEAQVLVAPEMQITHETSALGWLNWLSRLLMRPPSGITFDIDGPLYIAHDHAALVDDVGRRLCPDGLSDVTRSKIEQAISRVPVNDRRERVMGAIVLIAASNDFLIER